VLGIFWPPTLVKKNEKVKPKEDSEADHDDIPFLMKDIVVRFNGFFVSPIICGAYQRGEKVEDVCTDDANPIIVRVIDTDEDIEARYAIVIENQSVLTCCHLLSAIFTLFAVHYVFDIEYHPKAKDFYLLLEEKMFGIKRGGVTHSVNYVNIVTSMETYLN